MKTFVSKLEELQLIADDYEKKLNDPRNPRIGKETIDEFVENSKKLISEFKSKSEIYQKAFFHQHEQMKESQEDSPKYTLAKNLKKDNEEAIINLAEKTSKSIRDLVIDIQDKMHPERSLISDEQPE